MPLIDTLFAAPTAPMDAEINPHDNLIHTGEGFEQAMAGLLVPDGKKLTDKNLPAANLKLPARALSRVAGLPEMLAITEKSSDPTVTNSNKKTSPAPAAKISEDLTPPSVALFPSVVPFFPPTVVSMVPAGGDFSANSNVPPPAANIAPVNSASSARTAIKGYAPATAANSPPRAGGGLPLLENLFAQPAAASASPPIAANNIHGAEKKSADVAGEGFAIPAQWMTSLAAGKNPSSVPENFLTASLPSEGLSDLATKSSAVTVESASAETILPATNFATPTAQRTFESSPNNFRVTQPTPKISASGTELALSENRPVADHFQPAFNSTENPPTGVAASSPTIPLATSPTDLMAPAMAAEVSAASGLTPLIAANGQPNLRGAAIKAVTANNSGTGVASTVPAMKNSDKVELFAEQAGQKLPGAGSTRSTASAWSSSVADLPPRLSEKYAADFAANFIGADLGNKPVAATDLTPPLNVVAAPSDAQLALAERTHDLVSLHALRLVESKADMMSVVLKPSAGTELSLELRTRDGVVEATAFLSAGNHQWLNQHWSDLQARLETQGVKLGPLGGETNFNSGNGSNGNFSRQQPSERDERTENALAFAEFAATTGGASARSALKARGWESWA